MAEREFEQLGGREMKAQASQLELRRDVLESLVGELEFILQEEIPDERVSVLYQEAKIGQEIGLEPEAAERREIVSKAFKVFGVLHKAINEGLIKTHSDARDLATVLMNYQKSPGGTISYLRGTKKQSAISEPIPPRALINAIDLHTDIIDACLSEDTEPSLAQVILSAESLGINLNDPIIDADSLYAISSGISPFDFKKTITRSDEYGDTYNSVHRIHALSVGKTVVGFALASPDDVGPDKEMQWAFEHPDENLPIDLGLFI